MTRTSELFASLPLVGRDSELAMLRSAVDETGRGHGATLILSGESGVGKTRLTQAVREQAEGVGFAATTGTAFPVEVGVPYAPWTDALQPIVQSLDPATIALLTRGGSAELAQILPTLAGTAGGRALPGGDPAEQKAKLLWTLSQFLTRLAERRPLLIILENLQWADAASLELLHFIARQCAGIRLLLLCTYNETERDRNEALRAAEKSLVSLKLARVHRLPPLKLDALRELLIRIFGSGGGELNTFCEQLYSWTRGNAFFIDQTLRSLVESERLVEHDGVWHGWNLEAFSVPSSVKDTLAERIRRLSPRARAVLELLAVIGTRARHPVLLAASALSQSELLEALDELRGAQIVAEGDERGEVVYDITHPMLRQTLVEDLGLVRSRLLHRGVAEALERVHGERAMEHADELAFHYSRAGAAELTGKTVAYLIRAGRSALAKSANREAALYLDSALRLLEGDDESDPEELVSVMEQLAEALQRNGDHDAAFALWMRARSAAAGRDDLVRVAALERRLGLACYWRGRREDALRHYQLGLDAALEAGAEAVTARLLLTRGMCFQDLGNPKRGEEDLLRARAIAEAANDPALLARVHRTLLLLYVLTGRIELAREHATRALEFAEVLHEPAMAWAAHSALAYLGGLTGDFESTFPHQREAERLAEELRSPLLRVRTAEMTVTLSYVIGDWDRAIAVGEHAVTLARLLELQSHLPRIMVWLGLVYLGRDELERGRSYMEEAWELSGAGRPASQHFDVHAVIVAHIGISSYHLTTLNYEEAIAVANAGLAIADRHGYVVYAIFRLLPIIIIALLWMSRFDEADELWQRLRRDSERIGHRLGALWAETGHALVDTLRGTTRAALLRVEESADLLEKIPYLYDSASLRREIARRWVELGDRDRALQTLRRAHDIFARLGAAGELRGTREQIRELGARPPSVAAAPGVAGLSQREIEIVRLVAARKSNKEIGRDLGISARTVSTHLSNIFAKLAVSSRGELADLARAESIL